MTHEIVIASHKESLGWVKFWEAGNASTSVLPDSKVTVCNSKAVSNRGREASQWLYHICKNYDTMADYTFFVQADLGAAFGSETENLYWPHDLNTFRGFRPPEGDFDFLIWPSHASVKPGSQQTLCCGEGDKIAKLWGFEPQTIVWPDVFPMAFLGAQHVVSRQAIHRLQKSHYENCLDKCDDSMAFYLEYGKWPTLIYDIFRQGPLRRDTPPTEA
jgi:hypothetical protein